MNADDADVVYRIAFASILLICISISATYRLRARREAGTIPRRAEGLALLLARLLFALPLAIAVFSYPIVPQWLAWSALDLPAWLRAAGIALGLATVPALVWMFRSIGSNISETVLTRRDHRLVIHGPYRWVRHPLYALGFLLLVALGLISDSGFLLAFSAIALFAIARVVIPREEANLIESFGEEYRGYMRRTGRLLPRIARREG